MMKLEIKLFLYMYGSFIESFTWMAQLAAKEAHGIRFTKTSFPP